MVPLSLEKSFPIDELSVDSFKRLKVNSLFAFRLLFGVLEYLLFFHCGDVVA